jgi:hypothetical protein
MTFDPNITQRLKRRIIPNWKSRLKDYSTVALGLLSLLQGLLLAMPAEWKAGYLQGVELKITFAIAAWGLIGKFLTQPKDS